MKRCKPTKSGGLEESIIRVERGFSQKSWLSMRREIQSSMEFGEYANLSIARFQLAGEKKERKTVCERGVKKAFDR